MPRAFFVEGEDPSSSLVHRSCFIGSSIREGILVCFVLLYSQNLLHYLGQRRCLNKTKAVWFKTKLLNELDGATAWADGDQRMLGTARIPKKWSGQELSFGYTGEFSGLWCDRGGCPRVTEIGFPGKLGRRYGARFHMT